MMMMTIPFLFLSFHFHIYPSIYYVIHLEKERNRKKKLINPLPPFFGGPSHSQTLDIRPHLFLQFYHYYNHYSPAKQQQSPPIPCSRIHPHPSPPPGHRDRNRAPRRLTHMFLPRRNDKFTSTRPSSWLFFFFFHGQKESNRIFQTCSLHYQQQR